MADFCKRQNYLPHNLALHFAENQGFHGGLTLPISIHNHYICEYYSKHRSDFRTACPHFNEANRGFQAIQLVGDLTKMP